MLLETAGALELKRASLLELNATLLERGSSLLAERLVETMLLETTLLETMLLETELFETLLLTAKLLMLDDAEPGKEPDSPPQALRNSDSSINSPNATTPRRVCFTPFASRVVVMVILQIR